MPNWCQNELTIKATQSEIARFLNAVRSEDSRFDFNTISPQPETFGTGDTIKECYEWRYKNWGTNHPIDDSGLWISPGSVSPDTGQFQIDLCFDSAWTPPIPLIREASKRFPTLEFYLEYFELDGCFFEGVYQVRNGITLMERHGLIDQSTL
jgi:hypothetical protein